MKKNLAILLVVATLLTCMLGFSASAEVRDVDFITVPMRTTLTVLFAVKREAGYTQSYDTNNRAVVHVRTTYSEESGWGGNKETTYVGTVEIDGEFYWVYESTAFTFADIDSTFGVKLNGSSKVTEFVISDYLARYAEDNAGSNNGTLADTLLKFGRAVADYASK